MSIEHTDEHTPHGIAVYHTIPYHVMSHHDRSPHTLFSPYHSSFTPLIAHCTTAPLHHCTGSSVAFNRRPHFLAGPGPTPDAPVSLQCLPPLQNKLFVRLHPLRGAVSNSADWALIRVLCDRLLTLLARGDSRQLIRRSSIADINSVSKSGRRNLIGQVSDDKGVVRFGSGDTFKGSVKGGVLDGYGVYRHVEGDIYRGEFRGNQMNGVGTYTYADGEKYAGEWYCGMKHGTGTFLFTSKCNVFRW